MSAAVCLSGYAAWSCPELPRVARSCPGQRRRRLRRRHGSPGLLPLAQPQVPVYHCQLRGREGERAPGGRLAGARGCPASLGRGPRGPRGEPVAGTLRRTPAPWLAGRAVSGLPAERRFPRPAFSFSFFNFPEGPAHGFVSSRDRAVLGFSPGGHPADGDCPAAEWTRVPIRHGRPRRPAGRPGGVCGCSVGSRGARGQGPRVTPLPSPLGGSGALGFLTLAGGFVSRLVYPNLGFLNRTELLRELLPSSGVSL